MKLSRGSEAASVAVRCAFLVAATFAMACILAVAPAWASDDICGYAYLEPNADDPETFTLCIEKDLRTSGLYQELGPIPKSSATGSDLPWVSPLDQREKISAIKVAVSPGGKVSPETTAWWFSEFTKVTSIDLSGLDTANTTSMAGMFWDCWSLASLDLSPLDTSCVTDMWGMFYYCSRLTSLDLSGFNTANVTDMSTLFGDCSKLASVDFTGFNTARVKYMNGMFSGCSSLAHIDLSPFDTSQVVRMDSMFTLCRSLVSVKISHFNTAKVEQMSSMFEGCPSLTDLDVSQFDTSSITTMSSMFNGCSSLENLDVSGFDTSHCADMSAMFSGCRSLTQLDVSHFDTARANSMFGMFNGCSSLIHLDLSSFDVSGAGSLNWMLQNCTSLESVNLSGVDMSQVADLSGTFDGCLALSFVNLEGVTYPSSNPAILLEALKVNNLQKVVLGPHLPDPSACEGLFSIASTWAADDDEALEFSSAQALSDYLADADSAITLKVSSEYLGIFAYGEEQDSVLVLCPEAKALEEGQRAFGYVRGSFVPWKDTASTLKAVRIEPGVVPQSAEGWFEGCYNLVRVDGMENLDASQLTNMRNMFNGCSSLAELDLSRLDMSEVVDAGYLCCSCSSLVSVKLPDLPASKLEYTDGMFSSCPSLAEVDLSRFDVSRVTSMNAMFSGCSSLEHLDLSKLNTESVTDISYMFSGCSSLGELDLSGFNTSQITNMGYLFFGCGALSNLDLSSFQITANTVLYGMFDLCTSLSALALPSISGISDYQVDLLAGCENLRTVQVQEQSSLVPRFPRGMWSAEASNVEYRYDAIPAHAAAIYEKVSDEPCWYALLSSDGALSIGLWPVSENQGDTLYRLFDGSQTNEAGAPWREQAERITSVQVEQGVAPTSTAHWFQGCTALSSLDLSMLDTWGTSDFSYMFYGCSSLRELDLANFSTRNATAMKRMFHGCRSLERVTFGPDFAFRGATWSRLPGSELPTGPWQADDAMPDEEGRLHAYASDSIPSLVAASYHRVDGTAEGLVVETLRGDTAENEQNYTVETELVPDGAGGYEAQETYVLSDEFNSGELVVGESSGASALGMVNPAKGTVTAQTLKAIKGDKSVTTIIIGPKVSKIKAEAFAGCPYVKVIRVRSAKLNKTSKVSRCLSKSNITDVIIDKRYVKSSDAKRVKTAFKKAARPSKKSCTIRYSAEAR